MLQREDQEESKAGYGVHVSEMFSQLQRPLEERPLSQQQQPLDERFSAASESVTSNYGHQNYENCGSPEL